jgi:hypothetical protein
LTTRTVDPVSSGLGRIRLNPSDTTPIAAQIHRAVWKLLTVPEPITAPAQANPTDEPTPNAALLMPGSDRRLTRYFHSPNSRSISSCLRPMVKD